MNCKPGDLAVIVRSEAGNEGKFVTCLRLVDRLWIRRDGSDFRAPSWEVDVELGGWGGDWTSYVPDSSLRPIRGQPGDDETLAWAGKPNELPADVIREVTACN